MTLGPVVTVYSPEFNMIVLRNDRECPTVEVWRRNEDSIDAMNRVVTYIEVMPDAREAEMEARADTLWPRTQFRTEVTE